MMIEVLQRNSTCPIDFFGDFLDFFVVKNGLSLEAEGGGSTTYSEAKMEGNVSNTKRQATEAAAKIELG